MKIKEIYKNIMNKISNLVTQTKNSIKRINAFIKEVYKEIIGDKVDVAMFSLAIILSILDFVTEWDLTGALALLTVYISGLLFRIAVWRMKIKMTKKE